VLDLLEKPFQGLVAQDQCPWLSGSQAGIVLEAIIKKRDEEEPATIPAVIHAAQLLAESAVSS
jgi:hypothetical protein